MKFTPHETYDGLLTQAKALARLVDSLEGQVSHFRQKNYALSESRLQALESSLESERAMNSTLTTELEHFKQTLQNVVDGNYPHGDRRGKCPHGTYHWESCENCITDYIEAQVSFLQPSLLEQQPNEQNPLDPALVMETLQREEFIERDVL